MPSNPGATSAAALKYNPRYCAEVVEFMGRGYSLTAFAGEIGASRSELAKWCQTHPPFAAAVERAQARRARLLEDHLLTAKGANAFGAHMEALKTAAPDEWMGKRDGPARRGGKATRPIYPDLPDNGRG